MKTFCEFITEAAVMPTWGEMNKTPQQRAADAARREQQKKASQAHVMPTFAELAKKRKAGMSEEEILEFIGKFFKKKPATPEPKFKKPKNAVGHGDQAYRTNHHYGGGDIDPQSVPVFKPSWQTAGR